MAKKSSPQHSQAWVLDQIAKSSFFHRKLHEWKLIEIADQIDQVHGEDLDWYNLDIAEAAWKKVIHRGIKPVKVFAHPVVLQMVHGSVGYYRMLAMVSQKSMKRVGLNTDILEHGAALLDNDTAQRLARHLNHIVSQLIEADEYVNPREFDLWRGMAAGSQAQGSWQNSKGDSAEIAIREMLLTRLQARGLLAEDAPREKTWRLLDGRQIVMADEPDIAIWRDGAIQIAIEIKGGIDPAAVLERIGAAIKSLQRTRQQYPHSVTILILQEESVTDRAQEDLNLSTGAVSYRFSTQRILETGPVQEEFWSIIGI